MISADTSGFLIKPPHAITLRLLKERSNKTNGFKNVGNDPKKCILGSFLSSAVLKNYISCMVSSSK